MRYISNKNISFSLLMGKASKRFDFLSQSNGTSIYVTDNADEIKALEASDMYKNGLYKRVAGEKDPRPVKQKKEKPTAVDTISTLQDAVEYLVNLGVDPASLTTPDEIVKAATEKGVSFPNMK